MQVSKIYIVIPAYNEEDKIRGVLESLLAYYEHVIVVDDCSGDDTYRRATQSGAIVVRHILNRGQGAALDTGTKLALEKGADIIVHFDADGQFSVKDIELFIKELETGNYDIVMGSRFMDKTVDMPWFKKSFIMPVARMLLRYLYGAKLSDPQNGFRAFNRAYAESLEIRNDGAAHCTEIIANTLKNKWRYKEIPVTVKYEKFGQGIFSGKGRGSGGLKIIKSLIIQKIIG